jgi:hypothetical protein
MSQPDDERRERDAERAADTCRNGVENCAGPAAFDLSSAFYVPICSDCAREGRGQ